MPSVVCVLAVWFSWIVVFAVKVGGVVITGVVSCAGFRFASG